MPEEMQNGSMHLARAHDAAILPTPANEPHAELYASIRTHVIWNQSASTKEIKKVFNLGSGSVDKILHHFRREGIVARGPHRQSHWRVILSREQAYELGILDTVPAEAMAGMEPVEEPEPLNGVRPELLEEARFILLRDGIALPHHLRLEIPGITGQEIASIFRTLEREKILIREGAKDRVSWRVDPKECGPRLLEIPKDAYRPERYAAIREYVIRNQRINWPAIKKTFGIRWTMLAKVLQHLRNERILSKKRSPRGHWRVLVNLEQAYKLGIIAQHNVVVAESAAPGEESKSVAPVDATEAEVSPKPDLLADLTELRDLFGAEVKAGRTIQAAIERLQRLEMMGTEIDELLSEARKKL